MKRRVVTEVLLSCRFSKNGGEVNEWLQCGSYLEAGKECRIDLWTMVGASKDPQPFIDALYATIIDSTDLGVTTFGCCLPKDYDFDYRKNYVSVWVRIENPKGRFIAQWFQRLCQQLRERSGFETIEPGFREVDETTFFRVGGKWQRLEYAWTEMYF